MARVVEGLHRLWVFVRPVPHHKESGLHLIAAQDVDELLGVLVAPGRIEADGGQLLVPLDAVDGQLPLGSRGVHGGGVVDRQTAAAQAARDRALRRIRNVFMVVRLPNNTHWPAPIYASAGRGMPLHCLGNTGARKPRFRALRLSEKSRNFSDSLQKCRYFCAAVRRKSPRFACRKPCTARLPRHLIPFEAGGCPLELPRPNLRGIISTEVF